MKLTNEEKQKLLACIDTTIGVCNLENSPVVKPWANCLNASADLLPLAQKIAAPEPQDAPTVSE